MSRILQWNLQFIKTKYSELKISLEDYKPCCVRLQETIHGNRQLKPPSGYTIFQSERASDDGHERGTAILINRRVHENSRFHR